MLDYGDEDSVRARVNLVLLDVGASLRTIHKGQFKFTFYSELSTFGDAGDLWVVRTNDLAVGVVKVEKPGTYAMHTRTFLGSALTTCRM